MATAYLFPGQGAQQVGMGQDLCAKYPAAAAVFDQAESVTGLELRKLCFEGPEEQLARTDISQPAIFTMSMAVLAAVGERASQPDICAGLSLGEYTALCAAGAIEFEVAADLVAKRGRYMQDAAEAFVGGMVSIMGADEAIAQTICDKATEGTDDILVPANFNCPGQIVLSGAKTACAKAAQIAAECGANGAVELNVAGAFHSPLMQPAADRLREALAVAEIKKPQAIVLSNVTAKPHGETDQIRKLLLEQLTQPVRWQGCCEAILEAGAEPLLEMGPGRVLAGLMRRVDRKARVMSLNSADAIEKHFNG